MSTPTAEPPPTLELPGDRLLQWSHLALVLGDRLASRRDDLDRHAWSDAEHAARAHDRAEDAASRTAAEPSVRPMTVDEIGQWPQQATAPAAGSTGASAGPVTADVALVGDRWGVRARAHQGGELIGEAWVSCRDETTARRLAGETLDRGYPGAVDRLDTHVRLAAEATRSRATAASRVDRDAIADELRQHWPPEAADAAIGCRAWPTLAGKIDAAARDGHDVGRLLDSIRTDGIPGARKPAALASHLIDRATPAPGGPQGGQRPDAGAATSRDDMLEWVDQLDPRSETDRLAAAAVAGHGGPTVDARLATRFPGLLEEAAHWQGTAETADGRADDHEQHAAAHRATVDDPATTEREDITGQGLAHGDLHQAAAERATAAEARGTADAAAARAAVTTTPSRAASTQTARRAVTQPPQQQPPTPRLQPPRTRR